MHGYNVKVKKDGQIFKFHMIAASLCDALEMVGNDFGFPSIITVKPA